MKYKSFKEMKDHHYKRILKYETKYSDYMFRDFLTISKEESKENMLSISELSDDYFGADFFDYCDPKCSIYESYSDNFEYMMKYYGNNITLTKACHGERGYGHIEYGLDDFFYELITHHHGMNVIGRTVEIFK